MQVVGCPLAAAVVARIDSILKRVAMFFSAGSSDASTGNGKPPRGNENYNGEMLVLRYLYVLALVVWLGGMVMAGAIVAPSIFVVLERWNAAEGRVLGGAVFGEVLRRLHLLGYGMGAVMFVALTLKRLLGPRPMGYGIRVGIIGAMLAFSIASGRFVGPRVEAITHQVSGPIMSLPESDPRRVEFSQLHGYSNWLLGLTVFGGLALLWWEAQE